MTHYKKYEWARRDKWSKDLIYAGKEYDNNVYQSEVITMGIEQMFVNPAKFAKEDPEFFDRVYDVVVRGNVE